MVFMATGITNKWSVTLGYFLIGDSMTASERGNLLTIAVEKVNSTGAVVVNTVCDGPNVHFNMLGKMGAQLNGENVSSKLNIKNNLGKSIVCFLDSPHNIKSIRNCFGDKKVILNREGQHIKWDHISELHNIQEKEGLHLANKLKKKHLDYKRNIMSVPNAVQTLSESVATSIRFCDEALDLENFRDSKATAEFIQNMNDDFDFLNSSTLFGKGLKAALTEQNFQSIDLQVKTLAEFIKGLTLENGQPLIKGQRKNGFIGMLVNMDAVRFIFQEYVLENHMRYIMTRKLQQDKLEHLFGCIRACSGGNNNPSTTEFQTAYKRLLLGAVNRAYGGNCEWLTDLTFVTTSVEASNMLEKEYDLSHDEFSVITEGLKSESEFKINCLTYIAGYVTQKLIHKEQCVHCLGILKNYKVRSTSIFLEMKNRGRLCRPPSDVLEVVRLSNSVFEAEAMKSTVPADRPDFMKVLINKVARALLEKSPSIFQEMDYHLDSCSWDNSHKLMMIKKITSIFVTMRLKHWCRQFNTSQASVRKVLTKQILFKHQ